MKYIALLAFALAAGSNPAFADVGYFSCETALSSTDADVGGYYLLTDSDNPANQNCFVKQKTKRNNGSTSGANVYDGARISFSDFITSSSYSGTPKSKYNALLNAAEATGSNCRCLAKVKQAYSSYVSILPQTQQTHTKPKADCKGTLLTNASNAEAACPKDSDGSVKTTQYQTKACKDSVAAVQAYENSCGQYVVSRDDFHGANAVAQGDVPNKPDQQKTDQPKPANQTQPAKGMTCATTIPDGCQETTTPTGACYIKGSYSAANATQNSDGTVTVSNVALQNLQVVYCAAPKPETIKAGVYSAQALFDKCNDLAKTSGQTADQVVKSNPSCAGFDKKSTGADTGASIAGGFQDQTKGVEHVAIVDKDGTVQKDDVYGSNHYNDSAAYMSDVDAANKRKDSDKNNVDADLAAIKKRTDLDKAVSTAQDQVKADNAAVSTAKTNLDNNTDPTQKDALTKAYADANNKLTTDNATLTAAQNNANSDTDTMASLQQKLATDERQQQGDQAITDPGRQAIAKQDIAQQKLDADQSSGASKSTIKADEKQLSQTRKANLKANGDMSMQDKGDASKGCGRYGGADCTATGVVNGLAKIGDTVGSQQAANSVNNSANQAMNNVQAKGVNATAADYAVAQSDAAKAAAKAEGTMATVDTVAAALQMERLAAHFIGKSKVKSNEDKQYKNVEKSMDTSGRFRTYTDGSAHSIAPGATFSSKLQFLSPIAQQKYDAAYQAEVNKQVAALGCTGKQSNNQSGEQCRHDAEGRAAQTVNPQFADQLNSNIQENAATEMKAQNDALVSTATSLASTVSNIIKHKMAQKADQIVATQATPSSASGFLFNPSASNGNNSDGVAPTGTPETGAVTSSNDNGAPALDSGAPQFNPGGDQNPNDGPAPAPQVASQPTGGAGSPITGGGSGGTTAAKDDAQATAQNGKSKNEAGSNYSSSDNGGTFSRSGNNGSAGVGMDTGFADLLKKLLPGEEGEKKEQRGLALDQDRSPASDKAAVIARNKNIFEEIHKRYEKKSGEGAIVF